jgi:hypothetical protein
VRSRSATACFESDMGEVSRGSRRPHRLDTALRLFARRSCSPASSSSTARATGRRRYLRRSNWVVPPQTPHSSPLMPCSDRVNPRSPSAKQSRRTGQPAHVSMAPRMRSFPSPALSVLLPSSANHASLSSLSAQAAWSVHGREARARANRERLVMNPLHNQGEWRNERGGGSEHDHAARPTSAEYTAIFWGVPYR